MDRRDSKKAPKIERRCADCHSVMNLQMCRCANGHFLCEVCVKKSNDRSNNVEFYQKYRLWCDTCIWFDLG